MALGFAQGDPQEVASQWQSYLTSGVAASSQKKYSTAEQLMALAIKEAEKFNQNDPRLGSTLNTTGLIYMADSKPKEAEGYFNRAMVVFQKAYGEKSLDAANVSFNLGDSLRQQGNFPGAEALLHRTLEIYLAVLGNDSPKVAQVYFLLGDTQRHLHNYEAAETNLKRAADMRESLNGMESTDLAAALNSLALCYAAQSKFAQAEPLFKLSLNIREAKFGLNHKDVLESLENYAAMLRDSGRTKDGEKIAALADAVRGALKTGK
jgi:tetratricopeptide (TPR) repeat protein